MGKFTNWTALYPPENKRPVWSVTYTNSKGRSQKLVIKCESYDYRYMLEESQRSKANIQLLKRKMRRSFEVVSRLHESVARTIVPNLGNYPIWRLISDKLGRKDSVTRKKLQENMSEEISKFFDHSLDNGGDSSSSFLVATDWIEGLKTGDERAEKDRDTVRKRLDAKPAAMWGTLGGTIAVDMFCQNADRCFVDYRPPSLNLENVFFDDNCCVGAIDPFHTQQEETLHWIDFYSNDDDFKGNPRQGTVSVAWLGNVLLLLDDPASKFWKDATAAFVKKLADKVTYTGDRQTAEQLVFEGLTTGYRHLLTFANSGQNKIPINMGELAYAPVQIERRARFLVASNSSG